MEKMKLLSIVIFSLVILISCKKSEYSPAEFVEWVEDKNNGLLQDQDRKEYRYSFLLKPKEYLVLKSMKANDLSGDLFLKALEDYENLNYASLWIESNNGQPILKRQAASDNNELAMYYSFGLQKDLFLLEGNDTLKCVYAHQVQDGGISNRLHFLLAFEQSRNKEIKSKTFLYRHSIANEENILFTFDMQDFSKVPKIQFDKL